MSRKHSGLLCIRGCYNKYNTNYIYKYNINNYRVERNLRQKNKNHLRQGMSGRTRFTTHTETIGLTPIMFYKWIKFNMGIDELDMNDIMSYPIDHFIPLQSEEIDNYDKNKWYNLINVTKAANKIKKNNVPTPEQISFFCMRVEMFKELYINQ